MGLDVVAISALVYGLFLPRHRRMDLVVVYALFNIGLFVALVVISAGEVGIGVGFGLFAVLSIVRLRSEPFSNRELAYFFIALVLALVCAIDLGNLAFTGVLAALALLAAWAIDHPRVSPPARRMCVTLEQAFNDGEPLRRHLEERLRARVVDLTVLEIDYVRDTTKVDIRYRPLSPAEAPEEAADVAVLAP
jgi:hypothetical protein